MPGIGDPRRLKKTLHRKCSLGDDDAYMEQPMSNIYISKNEQFVLNRVHTFWKDCRRTKWQQTTPRHPHKRYQIDAKSMERPCKGHIIGQNIGQTIGLTIGHTVRQTVGQTIGRTRGQTIGRTIIPTIRQTIGQTKGQTIRQISPIL